MYGGDNSIWQKIYKKVVKNENEVFDKWDDFATVIHKKQNKRA